MSVAELAPGLWRWTARHPDWHPADAFGAEVASYALVAGDELLLVDPLLPDDGETAPSWSASTPSPPRPRARHPHHHRLPRPLSRAAARPLRGPHPRPQERRRPARRHQPFTILKPGVPGPAGTVAYAIGSPRRTELPLWLPSHKALAFGDALVTNPDGKLRMWAQKPRDAQQIAFYRSRFAPTLDPLRDLPAQRILTTHGPPILNDGATMLAAALDTDPWFHRG